MFAHQGSRLPGHTGATFDPRDPKESGLNPPREVGMMMYESGEWREMTMRKNEERSFLFFFFFFFSSLLNILDFVCPTNERLSNYLLCTLQTCPV